jgi:dephospho-CoA kinase
MSEGKRNIRIMLVGEGTHGKDEVAKILVSEYGMKCESSSMFACKLFIFDALKDKYGYESVEACYEDRVNHRAEWFDLISEYNKDNPTRLAKGIFNSNDVYVGIRNKTEFEACRREGEFDYAIWVDAFERLGHTEGTDSNQITPDMADFNLDNNGTLEDLPKEVRDCMQVVKATYMEREHTKQLNAMTMEKGMVIREILRTIMPAKQKKLGLAKQDFLNRKFNELMDLGINMAQVSTDMLTNKWPAMESKLHSMEQLIAYMDKKWIVSVNPEKYTKKQIAEASEFFSIEDLIKPVQETNEEAMAGFEAAQDA